MSLRRERASKSDCLSWEQAIFLIISLQMAKNQGKGFVAKIFPRAANREILHASVAWLRKLFWILHSGQKKKKDTKRITVHEKLHWLKTYSWNLTHKYGLITATSLRKHRISLWLHTLKASPATEGSEGVMYLLLHQSHWTLSDQMKTHVNALYPR